MNKAADALSRPTSPYEWQLNPAVFQYIDGKWGPHTIDRCLPPINSIRKVQQPVLQSIYSRSGCPSPDRLGRAQQLCEPPDLVDCPCAKAPTRTEGLCSANCTPMASSAMVSRIDIHVGGRRNSTTKFRESNLCHRQITRSKEIIQDGSCLLGGSLA